MLKAMDKITWWPAMDDIFLAKSAYALELDKGTRNIAETLTPLIKCVFWKFIWRLNISSYVKHFI